MTFQLFPIFAISENATNNAYKNTILKDIVQIFEKETNDHELVTFFQTTLFSETGKK